MCYGDFILKKIKRETMCLCSLSREYGKKKLRLLVSSVLVELGNGGAGCSDMAVKI